MFEVDEAFDDHCGPFAPRKWSVPTGHSRYRRRFFVATHLGAKPKRKIGSSRRSLAAAGWIEFSARSHAMHQPTSVFRGICRRRHRHRTSVRQEAMGGKLKAQIHTPAAVTARKRISKHAQVLWKKGRVAGNSQARRAFGQSVFYLFIGPNAGTAGSKRICRKTFIARAGVLCVDCAWEAFRVKFDANRPPGVSRFQSSGGVFSFGHAI